MPVWKSSLAHCSLASAQALREAPLSWPHGTGAGTGTAAGEDEEEAAAGLSGTARSPSPCCFSKLPDYRQADKATGKRNRIH